MKKKIMSLALALVMCLSLCVPAFAASSNNTRIIQDDNEIRIVQATLGNERYVATYNKILNTMTMERISATTGQLEASATTDLNTNQVTAATQNGISVSPENSTIPILRVSTGSRTTTSKFSYNYRNANSCTLSRPQYVGESNGVIYSFTTMERATNKSDLANFKITVENIYAKEQTIVDLVGTASFVTGCATGFLVGSGGAGVGVAIGAYLTALGFGVSAKIACNELGSLMETATTYFDSVRDDYIYYL